MLASYLSRAIALNSNISISRTVADRHFVIISAIFFAVSTFIADTFLLFLNSRTHSSLKSKTPLICVFGFVHRWNETPAALSINIYIGYLTVIPISSAIKNRTCASLTASENAYISAAALDVDVVGCFLLRRCI